MFWGLSAHEVKAGYTLLMSRPELGPQPSSTQAFDKNSVFLIEMLLPKKKHVLNFLDKSKTDPVQEACMVIFFDAQEHLSVTELSVEPCPPGQGNIHPGHLDPCVKSALLYDTLKEATKP